MCKGKCDTTSCTNHDYWYCNCNNVCFRCSQSRGLSGVFWGNYPWTPPREKYVCFDCKRIWKTRFTKYHNIKDDSDIEEDYKRFGKWIRDHPYEKEPTCTCGKKGIHVGENFRHCKNDNEWAELRLKYESGKIDMIKEFEGSAVRPKYLPNNNLYNRLYFDKCN